MAGNRCRIRRRDKTVLTVTHKLKHSAGVVGGNDRSARAKGFHRRKSVVLIDRRIVDGASVSIQIDQFIIGNKPAKLDSLTEADGPVPTYLDLLRVTTETIVKGLSE